MPLFEGDQKKNSVKPWQQVEAICCVRELSVFEADYCWVITDVEASLTVNIMWCRQARRGLKVSSVCY